MKKSILAAVIGANVIAMSAGAMADNIASDAGVTVSGGVGIYSTDKERMLHSDTEYNLGLGYRFNESWEAELNYMQSSHDGKGNFDGGSADVSNYRLDGIYYLSNGRFQPYLSAGVGENTYDYKDISKDKDEQINVGVGAKYFFTPGLFVRADARAFDARGGVVDTAATLSVGYLFGQEAKSTYVEPAPVAVAPLDDDNDGVVNDADNCPNTPAELSVDEHGCAVASDTPIIQDIQMEFGFGSDVINPEYDGQIEHLASVMKAYPTGNIVIEGHTDSKGAAAFNQKLSKQRADALANKLVSDYGIDESRITTVGKGESNPVASNDTAEGRKLNRRVIVTVDASGTAESSI
ncbi:OOP family OmpA-OmpF porin [Sinobacterium caligoides]|uniref:OOP family OmpA-OmpF porin n=1 Tax=Sinobacterium caligoides TaxID=933926 RepID=A0A3N2DME3_9GAMM|nr:OmpA family protein [Sinobacterium caligoides]ROS00963.1 OOP family OmpA-OmpF porin [Sinobacterium caligoides]